MRKLSGTILVLAGVCVGTYALLSGKNTGAFPPKTSADASVRAPTPAAQTPAEDAAAASAAFTAVVPPTAVNVADAAPRVPMGRYPSPYERPLDRAQLTRDIQFQLKRAGCYHGAIDGLWSAAVRRSMKAFTDRVNATLSVEQPDVVLLAMLQNHQSRGCGVPCPAGQGLAVDGRCLPHGLIAKIGEKHMPANSIPVATAPPPKLAVGQYGEEAPMALAGPPLTPAPADAPAKTGRRLASPPVGVSPSGRFPRWAARAFGNW
jgi:hypothetical protein